MSTLTALALAVARRVGAHARAWEAYDRSLRVWEPRGGLSWRA